MARRAQEIGIRLASRRAAAVLGLAGAMAASRLLRKTPFGIGAPDLALPVAIAARRAARLELDPMDAPRQD